MNRAEVGREKIKIPLTLTDSIIMFTFYRNFLHSNNIIKWIFLIFYFVFFRFNDWFFFFCRLRREDIHWVPIKFNFIDAWNAFLLLLLVECNKSKRTKEHLTESINKINKRFWAMEDLIDRFGLYWFLLRSTWHGCVRTPAKLILCRFATLLFRFIYWFVGIFIQKLLPFWSEAFAWWQHQPYVHHYYFVWVHDAKRLHAFCFTSEWLPCIFTGILSPMQEV